jgi:hypothetical protein
MPMAGYDRHKSVLRGLYRAFNFGEEVVSVLTGEREVQRPSRSARFGVLFLALIALGAACLSGATVANAKPAICDEYPDLPVCSETAGGGGDDNEVGSDEASGTATPVSGGDDSAGGAGGTGSGGELPFTGYPLTPLLLLLLLLVAIGLAIRAGIAVHDRIRRRGDPVAIPPPA